MRGGSDLSYIAEKCGMPAYLSKEKSSIDDRYDDGNTIAELLFYPNVSEKIKHIIARTICNR